MPRNELQPNGVPQAWFQRANQSGNDRPGLFVLSLDVELAWGSFDCGGERRFAVHFAQKRAIVRRLLALLDTYQVPVTWAFVGHLLLDHCERSADGTTHPEVLRPRYSWYPHDWHHRDPGSNLHSAPNWYGADLVEAVLKARVAHELGTHTFSHVIADDPACTAEIFRSQLEACIALHRRRGLKVDSMVFPRNGIAFLKMLPELGITAYRGREQRWYADLPAPLAKAMRMLDRALAVAPRTYPLAELAATDPVNIPASMFYLARDGFRGAIPISSRVRQAKRGLRGAAQRGELFHLWFHPFNLASDPRLFDGLEEIFRYAAALRDAGRLQVATMRDAAALVRDTGKVVRPKELQALAEA